MATGDANDMASRMLRVLPAKWFPDTAPVLNSILQGFGAGFAFIYQQIQALQAQSRMATSSDSWVDLLVADYRGGELVRRPGESDAKYLARFLPVFREAVTRQAMIDRLEALTGNTPWIFEMTRPYDTGAYGIALAYGNAAGSVGAGGYGSMSYPYQCLIQIAPPSGLGVANVAGYSIGPGGYGIGAIEYASLAFESPHVTSQDILDCITGCLMAGCTAWVILQQHTAPIYSYGPAPALVIGGLPLSLGSSVLILA